jgi:hypothetical protein
MRSSTMVCTYCERSYTVYDRGNGPEVSYFVGYPSCNRCLHMVIFGSDTPIAQEQKEPTKENPSEMEEQRRKKAKERFGRVVAGGRLFGH